jgi:hypothetical protein
MPRWVRQTLLSWRVAVSFFSASWRLMFRSTHWYLFTPQNLKEKYFKYSLFSYSPIFLINNSLFFTHFLHVLPWNFVQRNMCCEFIFLMYKLPRYFMCSWCSLCFCLHRIKIFSKSDSWQQLFVIHFLIFLFPFILTFVYGRKFSSFSPFTIYVAR